MINGDTGFGLHIDHNNQTSLMLMHRDIFINLFIFILNTSIARNFQIKYGKDGKLYLIS